MLLRRDQPSPRVNDCDSLSAIDGLVTDSDDSARVHLDLQTGASDPPKDGMT